MPVVEPHRCKLCSSSSWCSTNAALGQGCRAHCVHDKCPDPDAQYSGGAAVAGRHHPRRCAETGSHGLTVQQTTEILLLQYIDNAVDVGVQVRQALGAFCEETVEIPQLQLRCWTLSFTCLLLCNDRCLGWSRQCSFCGVPQFALFWTG